MDLDYSVSTTTRPRRPGEEDGKDYDFVDEATFDRLVSQNAFAEHAVVHGHRYGTRRDRIETAIAAGRDVLLDIDVQGARKIREAFPRDAVLIFIRPPSLKVLEARLRGRNTESEEVLRKRLARARLELAEMSWYDHVVVNDDLESALDALCKIIAAERRALPAEQEEEKR